MRNPASTCRIAIVVIVSCVSVFASASWANDASLPNAPTPSVMPANGHGTGSQGASVDSQTGTLARAPGPPTMVQRPGSSQHHFWDGENVALFSAVGASRALDYSSTLNMRRRGRQEILLTNDVVDNHPAFAAIEAGGTAVSVGASYLFHRYHHHRLEHWTSIVHASLTTSGAIRNYCLKTAHASTIP